MGNIDCTTIKQNDLDKSQQLKLNPKLSIKMNLVYPKPLNIAGDNSWIEPETNRLLTQLEPLSKKSVIQNNINMTKKKKTKKCENDLDQFMNELNSDNDYSKQQMRKLRQSSYYYPQKLNKIIKSKPQFKEIDQLQRLMDQQQKFIQTNKIDIDEERILKQTQSKSYLKSSLNSYNPSMYNSISRYSNKSKSMSLKQSTVKQLQKPLNQIQANYDTIIKKQDQKVISHTQTSNLMNLIYQLESNKSEYRSPVILTQNHEILNEPSFELQIFIDDVPSKVMVRKGDNLNELIKQFLQKNELPEEVHQKLIEDILINLQAS